MLNTIILVCFLFVIYAETADVGDACTKGDAPGTCKAIKNCRSAIEDIKHKKPSAICSFDGTNTVVCCPDGGAPDPDLLSTDKTITMTEASPEVPPARVCESLGTTKTGRKAWDKCIEYQERLVYPCYKNSFGAERADYCGYQYKLVIREDADRNEFPHMVVLGYGNSSESLQWLCSGALISERFILTAAHCQASRKHGPVTYVATAAYKLSELDIARLYKVKRVIRHPEYKPPSRYNDIALLETETEILLDRWAVPACLDTNTNNTEEKAIHTGWGPQQYGGRRSDILQMGIVTKFSTPECNEKYYSFIKILRSGIDGETQICYRSRIITSSTCQGDSGGPLQVRHKQFRCMYKIIGVTSFSEACGNLYRPGETLVYTRVSAFVPWIESVVWPEIMSFL